MAAALRTTYRSLNRSSDAYRLEMIARHRFHEGRKESNYEIARRHLKICEQSCTRLNSAGDLSVCYWTLGELASNEQYYRKATMFYEKAISMYGSARTFSQFQPALSILYARYSYAQAGKDRLLPQSHPTHDIEDEHRPNLQIAEPAPASPDVHSGTTESNDYKSKIHWAKGEQCQDVSHTYNGMVVIEYCESHVRNQSELEEAVEETDEGYAEIGIQHPDLTDEKHTNMPCTEKPFVTIYGDHNIMEASLVT